LKYHLNQLLVCAGNVIKLYLMFVAKSEKDVLKSSSSTL